MGLYLQPLICVNDVTASSLWYQRLLGLESGHGGEEYERLNLNGKLVLQLHKWDVHHDHGPIGDPDDRPHGNGILLWFELNDFEDAVARATALDVVIIKSYHLSENGNYEFWINDPDGYLLVLTSPLEPECNDQ